jgi:molybdopterin converting factor subunit 1
MKVVVRLFARAREAAGAGSLELEVPQPGSVADLRSALLRHCPALKGLASGLLFAVNSEFAADSTPVDAGSEIACFPPVSGG